MDWLEQKERLDTPDQKLDDLREIPLKLERGELQLTEWRSYLRKYRRLIKQVEDWSESDDIRNLLRDVLPAYWKKRVEDEDKKRARKRMAVRIMSHYGIFPTEPQSAGADDLFEEFLVHGGVWGDRGWTTPPSTKERRMEARGKAEIADDTRANEHGLHHPVRERQIEAQLQKRSAY